MNKHTITTFGIIMNSDGTLTLLVDNSRGEECEWDLTFTSLLQAYDKGCELVRDGVGDWCLVPHVREPIRKFK